MTSLNEQLKTILALGIPFSLVLYLSVTWYNAVDKVTGYHDYWGIFWNASATYGGEFWLGRVSILGKGSFGSAAFLRYIPWLYVAVLTIFAAQLLWTRHIGRSLNRPIVWANMAWLIYTLVMIFIGTGLSAMGHYMDLYSLRVTCPDGTILSLKGEVDWLTHWFSAGFFSLPLISINFYDLLRWHGRRGRFYEAALVLMVVTIIMLTWEIGESGNPSTYRNLLWDSVKDLWQGILSTVFNLLAFQIIVPFEVDES